MYNHQNPQKEETLWLQNRIPWIEIFKQLFYINFSLIITIGSRFKVLMSVGLLIASTYYRLALLKAALLNLTPKII